MYLTLHITISYRIIWQYRYSAHPNLQGAVVRVQVNYALEIEGDLEEQLWSRSKQSLESVEDDREVFKLGHKYAKNLGHEGG